MQKNVVYEGLRLKNENGKGRGNCAVIVVDSLNGEFALPNPDKSMPMWKMGNPFEWGCKTQGASLLAEAILRDYVEMEVPEEFVLAFRKEVVEKLDLNSWFLLGESVHAWFIKYMSENEEEL